MAREGDARSDAPLWVEQYASLTGLTALEAAVRGGDDGRYAPYAFVTLVWTLSTLGFAALVYVTAGTFPVFRTPGMVVLLPAWLFVVFLSRWMRDRYFELVGAGGAGGGGLPTPVDIGDDETHRYERWLRRYGVSPGARDDPLSELAPTWMKWVLLTGGLLVHGAWFFVDPSPMQTFTEVYGVAVARFYFLIVVPGVFFPLGVELIWLYVGLHLLLPLKVTMTDRIDFDDPQLHGGLRPLGVLVRNTSVAYLVLLSLFVVFEAVAAGSAPTDRFSLALLFGGIVFGALIFWLPLFWLHKYLDTMKSYKLNALAGVDGGPSAGEGFDDPEAAPKAVDEVWSLTHRNVRMRYIENMNEFPVGLAMVAEYLFTLVLPALVKVAMKVAMEGTLPR